MNRPIEFRAWHKTLKKMLYAPLTCHSGNLCIDNQDVEWLQFTGLLDKNNKEIYEGDILEWSDYQGWEDGRTFYGIYVVEWREEKCAFVLYDPHDCSDWEINETNFDCIKGNIFDNTYLLPKENIGAGEMAKLE